MNYRAYVYLDALLDVNIILLGCALVLKGIFRVRKPDNSDSSIRMKEAMTVTNSNDHIIATYCNYSDCICAKRF